MIRTDNTHQLFTFGQDTIWKTIKTFWKYTLFIISIEKEEIWNFVSLKPLTSNFYK